MNQETLTLEKLQEVAHSTMPRGSQVWLYGSRARGTARNDSDWDLLIILNKTSIGQEDYEHYCYPFVTLGWQYFADVSPQIYTVQEWRERELTPFYQNVEHDKQIVYGA